jgi:hydroxypyruvate isomerase
MLRLSANISTLFCDLPVLDRPAAAAAAGFTAIEMQFPYSVVAADLAAEAEVAGVEFVLINMPAGNSEMGELGLACLPGRQQEFVEATERAIDYARALKCPRVNCLAGNMPMGASVGRCWEVLIENVRHAAQRTAASQVQLLVEVLNNVDFPRFVLGDIAAGDALIAAVGHANLALQYDVYHRRAAGEDWLGGLEQRLARIGHIQFSDYPGRREPGTGELDISKLFALLERRAYEGWLGAEYTPSCETVDTFAWRKLLHGPQTR